MNLIILADKFQKGNKTKGWPGCIPVNKKRSLIENQVFTARRVFPKCKIYYVYGFDHRKVENYLYEKNFKNFVPIYNKKFAEEGETSAVACAADYLDTGSIIVGGDILLKPSNFKNFIDKNHLYSSNSNVDDLGCNINGFGDVEHIFYELPNYIMNMYYLDRKHIEVFRKIVYQHEYRNYFLFEIINKMIEEQGTKFSLINTEKCKKTKRH